MYISSVKISGFRNFKDIDISLHDGINILIGANNSGKSNLIKAIALTLNVDGLRRIGISDIFHEVDIDILKSHSPMVEISLICTQSKNEPDTSELAGLLSDYLLLPIGTPYNACINYRYSLSPDKEEEYLNEVSGIDNHNDIWEIISMHYSRFYQQTRWGGIDEKLKISHDLLDKIDFHFLDAIRDVCRDMCMGYNPMLKDVLDFFIDYEVKQDESKNESEIKEALKALKTEFKESSSPLMTRLHERLYNGKEVLLNYASSIGASFNNAKPDFSGQLSESEMFSVLRLIIRHELDVEIPATHNGLGYNNLIFMSLLLAKMQASSDGKYMGRQAKLYSLLAIEEPEAHLHPSMQYQFLNFLHKNKSEHSVSQILITTHSTQITSAVDLDNIICLHQIGYGKQTIGYPQKCYSDSEEDKAAKGLVQRYLDATRSDMFFAHKLIFVEGMAEEILIPTFARYLGYDLAMNHVLIVNTGLRYYGSFLKMFDSSQSNTIEKKVACITDIDPMRDGKACYPYEYGQDENSNYSRHGDIEIRDYSTHPNIRFFRQSETYGKTLEYDLAFHNPKCSLLVTPSIANQEELKEIIATDSLDNMLNALRKSKENDRIKESIINSNWSDEDKKKAIFASRYLNSVSKGCNALELSVALEQNRKLPDDDPLKVQFHVPDYIKKSIEWLFQ